MVKQGFRAPFPFELEEINRYRNVEKCPFCGNSLGKIAVMRRKAYKVCKCKKCRKLILDPKIYW